MYSVQLKGLSDTFIPNTVLKSTVALMINMLSSISLLLLLLALPATGMRTHFCLRLPMKSWRPIRAKTLRQNTVRIITSDSFLTDWIKAPTMVFKPMGKKRAKGKEKDIANRSQLLYDFVTVNVVKAGSL